MPSTRINDDTIWIKNIEAGPQLRERIMRLKPGEAVDLEVDGEALGPPGGHVELCGIHRERDAGQGLARGQR